MDKNNINPEKKITIVGGQPSGADSSVFNDNVEKLLLKAASDENFKKDFLQDRESVLKKKEFSLTEHDKMILGSIPVKQLGTMIDKFCKQRTSRRNFLRGAAASAALLAGGTIFSSAQATNSPPTGINPDYPDTMKVFKTIYSEGGVIDFDYSGLKIIIPEGALEEPMKFYIEICPLPGNPPVDTVFYGEVYLFSPEDFKFIKPVDIYFPMNGENRIVYAYLWNENKWTPIPGTVSDNFFVIETISPGIYTLGMDISKPEPTVTRGMDTDY